MFNATDILSLGTEYTVVDQKGNVLKQIQVITYSEILDAAIGVYLPEHGSYEDYLRESIKSFTGFENVNPHTVLWYTTFEEEIVLTDIMEYAVKNGYDKVIIEKLDEFEE